MKREDEELWALTQVNNGRIPLHERLGDRGHCSYRKGSAVFAIRTFTGLGDTSVLEDGRTLSRACGPVDLWTWACGPGPVDL
ncbi:hypothetical protein EYF80_059440 [Liparis tanakae]|uniref:Uncharacterized protein n=1 Tax=Liparis tanakae TaxID=230148 RepID=A0A4Z2ENN3_9TELE|nr:hypothetical protein EYF80_059440 [Liparis tanakae]